MREFALNSRHPSPRREEGGLRAAGHMPLPGKTGERRDPGENSGRLDSVRWLRRCGPFARKVTSNFRQNPEDAPRHPQEGQGGPKDSQRDPKAPHRQPKGLQSRPKWEPKARPKRPKASQRDYIYIYIYIYICTNSRSTAQAAVMLVERMWLLVALSGD